MVQYCPNTPAFNSANSVTKCSVLGQYCTIKPASSSADSVTKCSIYQWREEEIGMAWPSKNWFLGIEVRISQIFQRQKLFMIQEKSRGDRPGMLTRTLFNKYFLFITTSEHSEQLSLAKRGSQSNYFFSIKLFLLFNERSVDP